MTPCENGALRDATSGSHWTQRLGCVNQHFGPQKTGVFDMFLICVVLFLCCFMVVFTVGCCFMLV